MHSKLPGAAVPPHYLVEVPQRQEARYTLEEAFVITNQDDRPCAKNICSTAAGDLMILDGQAYLVEGVDYYPVTEAEAEAIKKLTTRETGWGYADLKRNNLI
jgi:hypothetical protein